MAYEYLPRQKAKPAKQLFIEKANKIIADSKDYFSSVVMLVGSSKRNLILVDKEKKSNELSLYDLDYQLIITKFKDKEYLNDPKKLKEYLKVKFENEFKGWKIENSTTAITLKNRDPKIAFSFDVVICSWIKNEFQVIKRSGQNENTWNKVKKYEAHYANLKKIKKLKLWNDVRQEYKNKKEANKNNSDQKSYLLFVDTVKEIIDKK